MLEHGGYVVGAARVYGQTVWQRRALEGVGHGVPCVNGFCELYQLRCRTLGRQPRTGPYEGSVRIGGRSFHCERPVPVW